MIHLSVAKEITNLLTQSNSEHWTTKATRDFYVGNILPDIIAPKKLSHYWDQRQTNNIIKIPHLDKFLINYQTQLSNKQLLGYYCHLYIDKFFYENFISQIVCFLDKNNVQTNLLKAARYAYLYKINLFIPYSEFWTNKYYYGEFDKSNAVLQEKCNIDIDKLTETIKNDDYIIRSKESLLLHRDLEKYLHMHKSGNLELFSGKDLMLFIKESAYHFIKNNRFLFSTNDQVV